MEFSTILLGIQITFIGKLFDKPIKISYCRKYIKMDVVVVFWKRKNNVSFQIILFLCIQSMFFFYSSPIKSSFPRAVWFTSFFCFFACIFFFFFFFPFSFAIFSPLSFALLFPFNSFSALQLLSSKVSSIVGFSTAW